MKALDKDAGLAEPTIPQVFDLAEADTTFEIESEYDFSLSKVVECGQQRRKEECSIDDVFASYHRVHITLDELLERTSALAIACQSIF